MVITMNKPGKRFPALLLALLLAASMTACGGDGTASTNDTTAADITAAPADTSTETGIVQANGNLTLAANGESLFTIVRGEDAPQSQIDAAMTFRKTMEANLGITLTLSTDYVKKNEDIDPNALEILIGTTNRAESAALAEGLAEQTFAIRTTDSKIIIAAADDLTLNHAVEYFFDHYTLELENATGTLRLAESIDFVSEPWSYYAEVLPTADTLTAKSERLFTVAKPTEATNVVQGGCVANGYLYQAFIAKDTASNEANNVVKIAKVDMATGKTLLVSPDLSLNHCNDITYNAKLNQLVVVHNNPNRNRISFLNPDTLELIEQKTIPYTIYSLDYNESRDQYVVGLSGGQSFLVLDASFKPTTKSPNAPTSRTNGYTTQGVACDDNYIYFVLYKENVITVYDWDGKFVSLIELDVGNVEPENLSIIGNTLYIVTTGGGAQLHRITSLQAK